MVGIVILAISPKLSGDRNQIQLNLDPQAFKLVIFSSQGSTEPQYVLDLKLYGTIIPEQSFIESMHHSKIEIYLKKDPSKVNEASWPQLETLDIKPQATKKGFTNIGTIPDTEIDKPQGDAALQHFFQSIYSNASDDVKKAMNKSFQESCGTCLSTNWEEVKKDRVAIKPPDGIEPKDF
jgi:suppressor of G2 allele of SKP1